MSDLTERARARAKSLNEGGGQWEFVEADDWNALCDTIDRLIAENERLEVEAIAMEGTIDAANAHIEILKLRRGRRPSSEVT